MKSQFYLIFTAIFIISFLTIFSIVYKKDYTKNYLEEKEIAENFYRENLILFSKFGKEHAIDFSKNFFKIYSLRKDFKFLNVYIQASSTLNITILNFLKSSTIKICSNLECYQNFIEFGKSYDFSLEYSSNYLDIYFENVYRRINISDATFISFLNFGEGIYLIRTSNITKKYFSACLIDFKYRIPILINNTQNSNNLNDYQILVTLNTQTLISQGKMRSDCGDIRFTDSDGTTLLNYWLESGCNTQNTRIWVKVPNIPASSTKTIYLYYGNPNANSLSNGDLVFDFFEDFERGTTGWNVIKYWDPDGSSIVSSATTTGYGSPLAGGIRLYEPGGGYASTGGLERTLNITTGFYLTFNAMWSVTSRRTNYDNFAIIVEATDGVITRTVAYRFITGGPPCGGYWNAFSGSCGNRDYFCLPPNTWTTVSTDVRNDFLSLCGLSINRITKIQIAVGSYATTIYGYADNIIIRKYTSPEPTISLGSEEVC